MHASPKFFVMDDIVPLLLADAELQGLVGNRVFPIIAPVNTRGDFISYQRVGVLNVQNTKVASPSLIRYAFVITAVSDDYNRSLAIAKRVFELLVGIHPFGRIDFEDFAERVVDQKFMQTIEFSIT